MYYGKILTVDVANGPGMRVTLFVSGCRNCCEGCFNKDTWDFKYGKEFTDDICEKMFSELAQNYCQGLTILGGEPLEPENQEDLLNLIEKFRNRFGNKKDIWLFSGFTYEEIHNEASRCYSDTARNILKGVDVLVDGRFVLAEKDVTLKFRGSRNQRIIDLVKTRKEGKLVLSPYNN